MKQVVHVRDQVFASASPLVSARILQILPKRSETNNSPSGSNNVMSSPWLKVIFGQTASATYGIGGSGVPRTLELVQGTRSSAVARKGARQAPNGKRRAGHNKRKVGSSNHGAVINPQEIRFSTLRNHTVCSRSLTGYEPIQQPASRASLMRSSGSRCSSCIKRESLFPDSSVHCLSTGQLIDSVRAPSR